MFVVTLEDLALGVVYRCDSLALPFYFFGELKSKLEVTSLCGDSFMLYNDGMLPSR